MGPVDGHPRPAALSVTALRRGLLRMRFGIGMMRDAQLVRGTGEHRADLTLEEVGQQFSVTRERIRQIEAKALRKLKHPSRSRKMRASSTSSAVRIATTIVGSLMGASFGAISAAPATARSIQELLSEPPQVTLSTRRPFYQVERCIVIHSSPTIPPYRTPDQPLETTFLSRDFVGTVLWTLTQSPDGLVQLRAYSGIKLLNGDVRACFS